MSPRIGLFTAGFLGSVLGIAFVELAPMPIFFPGSIIVLAAIMAGLLTLCLLAWMPERWLWTDAERLAKAFQAHHGLTDISADFALAAITEAHHRAESLRSNAVNFHEELKPHVMSAADRLDASAREIFYDPKRIRALRSILTRSELIEEATLAHRALRKRAQTNDSTVAQSREALLGALQALQDAFAASDLRAAKGHLEQVETASSVAEALLSPRQLVQRLKDGAPP
ncbi:MAG: hypothetical protein AAGC83_14080 [Pseudomonadota bacterium]